MIEDMLADILAKEIAKEIDGEVLVAMLANWPDSLYQPKMSGRAGPDLPYGWAGEHRIPNTIGFDKHMELYQDIVRWINSSVKNPKQNVFWNKIGDCIYVMFRKKQDYVLYLLKYGHYSNG